MKNKDNTSLTQIVSLASSGSDEAAERLAVFFLEKVNAASGKQLAGKASEEDKEDIAMSALRSFCIGIRDGKYEYQGHKQLYSLLNRIVDIKIRRMWQARFTQKRDVRLKAELDFEPVNAGVPQNYVSDTLHVTNQEQDALDQIVPELQTDIQGMFAQLFSNLSEHPRTLLLLMLESDGTVDFYAKQMGRSKASVERYQMQIREEIKKITDQA